MAAQVLLDVCPPLRNHQQADVVRNLVQPFEECPIAGLGVNVIDEAVPGGALLALRSIVHAQE